jgi:serine-type D-Ala-D-Ala carboxypeptidase (penicillin-binding protein 5/6)
MFGLTFDGNGRRAAARTLGMTLGVLAACVVAAGGAHAQAAPGAAPAVPTTPATPTAPAMPATTAKPAALTPQPPDVAARQWIVLDLTTGQVLGERDADTPVDPASLTKLMTAYVVFQALRDKKLSLEQPMAVSERAWNERKGDPSLMFINMTMRPTVDQLLRGMIVQSGNDASVALAEGVAGSVEAFVTLMNQQAQAFGLKNTLFANVTGMSQTGHRSSARDIATVATRIIQDFPDRYPYYAIKEWTYHNIRQDNRNLLLRRDPTVDGMKTGYTEAAGYCLVASAKREFPNGPRRLLSVVLGTASREARASESQKLLNWGYQFFDAYRLAEAGKPLISPEVWKGQVRQVKVGLGGSAPLMAVLPKGEGDKVAQRIERVDPLVAPLAQGQAVGKLIVTTAAGVKVAEAPLVVLEAVPQAGFFSRTWDALRLWIK